MVPTDRLETESIARRFTAPIALACLLFGLLFGLLTAAPALAGVLIEVETYSRQGTEMQRERSQISIADNGAMRIDTAPAGEDPAETATSMIFAANSTQATILDHRSQTFSTMGGANFEHLAQQIDAATRQLEEQIEKLPAEQQAALRDALTKSQSPASKPPIVHPTDDLATKNGFKCKRYMVRQGGRVVREAWVASWDQIPESDQVKLALGRLQDYFAGLVDQLEKHSSPLLGGDVFELSGQTFEDLDQMNGLPIVVTTIDNNDLGEEREVRRVSRRDFDAATFEPPKDYQPAADP